MNQNSIVEFNLDEIPYNESGELNSFLEPVFPLPLVLTDSINSDLNSPDQFNENQLPEKYKLIFVGNQGVGHFS